MSLTCNESGIFSKVPAWLILSRISSWIRVWCVYLRRFSFITVSAEPILYLMACMSSNKGCVFQSLLAFLSHFSGPDETRLQVLSEMWVRFFTDILPTLQAIFYPVQVLKWSHLPFKSLGWRRVTDTMVTGVFWLGLGSGVDCEANGSARLQKHGSVEASCGEHVSGLLISSSNHTDAADPAGELSLGHLCNNNLRFYNASWTFPPHL